MSEHIFPSHSSSDASCVERIRSRIGSRGIRCRMAPRDIPPAADLWRGAFLHANSGVVQRRTADGLAECCRPTGDPTEARRWRLLSSGEIPASGRI